MDGLGRNYSFIACTYHLGLAKSYTIVLGILIAYAIIANVLLVGNQFNHLDLQLMVLLLKCISYPKVFCM